MTFCWISREFFDSRFLLHHLLWTHTVHSGFSCVTGNYLLEEYYWLIIMVNFTGCCKISAYFEEVGIILTVVIANIIAFLLELQADFETRNTCTNFYYDHFHLWLLSNFNGPIYLECGTSFLKRIKFSRYQVPWFGVSGKLFKNTGNFLVSKATYLGFWKNWNERTWEHNTEGDSYFWENEKCINSNLLSIWTWNTYSINPAHKLQLCVLEFWRNPFHGELFQS